MSQEMTPEKREQEQALKHHNWMMKNNYQGFKDEVYRAREWNEEFNRQQRLKQQAEEERQQMMLESDERTTLGYYLEEEE